MSYKTSEAVRYRKEFANYVAEEANKQHWNLKPDKLRHFYADAVFYFDRIDKDPSNYWKVMLDAITDTQLIWLDDNTVCERTQRIYYDSVNPRVELEIYPVEYAGIFDNTRQMETFTSKCNECARNKGNCSILTKAKEGRIQKEISGIKCLKYKTLLK